MLPEKTSEVNSEKPSHEFFLLRNANVKISLVPVVWQGADGRIALAQFHLLLLCWTTPMTPLLFESAFFYTRPSLLASAVHFNMSSEPT